MAVPKKRTSQARRGCRRSHNAIKPPNLSICTNCQEPTRPHHVCPKCGWYSGREVVAAAAD